jgi:ABC-type transporter Mla MlaB component
MAHSDRVFLLEERFERDGALRLMLIGELDVAVIAHLSTRLRELRKEGYPVRLDLTELQFIDSSGIQEIIREVTEARRMAGSWTSMARCPIRSRGPPILSGHARFSGPTTVRHVPARLSVEMCVYRSWESCGRWCSDTTRNCASS